MLIMQKGTTKNKKNESNFTADKIEAARQMKIQYQKDFFDAFSKKFSSLVEKGHGINLHLYDKDQLENTAESLSASDKKKFKETYEKISNDLEKDSNTSPTKLPKDSKTAKIMENKKINRILIK